MNNSHRKVGGSKLQRTLFNSLFTSSNVSKKNAKIVTHTVYLALLELIEAVQMDIFFC